MRNDCTTSPQHFPASKTEVPYYGSTALCPLCGRSPAPFTVRRSALLDTLTLLVDVASEAHDADGRQLLLAIAMDAKAAAEEVAL